MPLAVGSRLGHYDVTALIGEGGMGEVCRVTHTKLDRTYWLGCFALRTESQKTEDWRPETEGAA